MTVVAHLTAAEQRAEERQVALPERLVRVQATRAKVIDISIGEEMGPRRCAQPPKQVLEEAVAAIGKARFTGRADKELVPQVPMQGFEPWTTSHAPCSLLLLVAPCAELAPTPEPLCAGEDACRV